MGDPFSFSIRKCFNVLPDAGDDLRAFGFGKNIRHGLTSDVCINPQFRRVAGDAQMDESAKIDFIHRSFDTGTNAHWKLRRSRTRILLRMAYGGQAGFVTAWLRVVTANVTG